MRTHTVYFRNIIKAMLKKWWLTLIFMAAFAAIFVFIGYRSAHSSTELSADEQEELETYEERCEDYETAISGYKTSVKTEQKEVKTLKTYCKNSLYMQIDPENVQVAVARLTIGVPSDGNTDVSDVVTALNQYITSTLPQRFNEKYPDEPVNYWPELIKSGSGSSTYTIKVRHFDMEQAILIRDCIVEAINSDLDDLKEVSGDFTIDKVKTIEFTTADSAIMADQADAQGDLASAQKNLAAYKTSLSNTEKTYDEYIENHEPDSVKTKTFTKSDAIRFGVFGVVAGFVVMFALVLLYFIFSTRIRGREEIEECGTNVLGRVTAKGEFIPGADRVVMDAELLLEGKGGVFISLLSESPLAKKTAEALAAAFEEKGIKTACGASGLDDTEELKTMIALGAVIIIAETGITRYGQIEKQVDVCRRFKAELVGCMELS